jgi:ammonia channel protein AmtB
MSLSGGLMAGYIVSRGDAFWTYSAGLCGVIGASAGNDLYHPIQAMLIGAVVPVICYKLHYWVERRFKIDDAVGAVAVHGYGGFLGVVIAGVVLWGYPASQKYADVLITPWGNFVGAIIMFFVLGFVPALIAALILKAFGLLRIPREIELVGLDLSEYAARYLDDEEVKKAEMEEARRTGLVGSAAE